MVSTIDIRPHFIVNNVARKVDSIEYVNGRTVIQTVEPEFSEVFKTFEISGDVELAEKHLNKTSIPRSISVSVNKLISKIDSQNDGNVFTYTIKDHVICDLDGDLNTTFDQILANGTIVLTKPYAHVGFEYGIFKQNNYVELYSRRECKYRVFFSKNSF